MANILIACGHDNHGNGGCVNTKYGTEQQFTRAFSKILVKPLRDKGHTVTVFNVYDSSKSLYTSLTKQSIDKMKLTKYDLIIELHFNAGVSDYTGNHKLTGTEILLHENSILLQNSKHILTALEQIGMKNRGVKYRSDLYNMNVCAKLNVPYMLWEICFMDDEDDMQFYMKNKESIANTFATNLSI